MPSKRKFDEVSGTDVTSAGSEAGPKCVAPVMSGWAALPPELIRGIGQLQSDARGLAAMERTCRPWRRVVMGGNDDPELPDGVCGDDGDDGGDDDDDENKKAKEKVKAKPSCLWRDLALTQFPRLASISKLVGDGSDPTCRRGDDKKFSWKMLYREQFRVSSRIQPVGRYQPTTELSDYIFSFEFRGIRDDELLFVTSCRGDERTPKLWDQNIEYHDGSAIPICQNPVDPRLVSRLGNNPFAEETLVNQITANVIVTRLSDMKAVKVATKYFDPRDGEYTDDDGDLVWKNDVGGNTFMPVKASSSPYNLTFYLSCESGRILFEINQAELEWGFIVEGSMERENLRVETSYCRTHAILRYLECQCPWPDN